MRTPRLPLFAVMLATLACQTLIPATPAPGPITAPPLTPTAPLPPGQSRHAPIPASPVVEWPGWRLNILEMQQGDAAWQTLREVNRFNPEPEPGQDYLLLRVQLTRLTSPAIEVSAFAFGVTGDLNLLYRPASVVTPESRFESGALAAGESRAGWVAFLTGKGETNRMVSFDIAGDELPPTYIALDVGARIPLDTSLYEIYPDHLGETPADPAPLGETATLDHWQITVLKTLNGASAWQALQAANPNNPAPPPGQHYWLAYVRLRLIDQRTAPTQVNAAFWQLATRDGALFDRLTGVTLPRPGLYATLFPNGETEGWWGGLAPVDTAVVGQFREFLAPKDPLNVRFFALDTPAP